VEISAKSRLFTGATRRGVEVRDRTCANDYCEVPADRCQVDHIMPFSQGGPTTQDNGALRCGFHNRQKGTGPPEDDEDDDEGEYFDDD
jgi:hypothetical protein